MTDESLKPPEVSEKTVTSARAELETAKNFLRQAREHLQNNNPVMAYVSLEKVSEYIGKTDQVLLDIEGPI